MKIQASASEVKKVSHHKVGAEVGDGGYSRGRPSDSQREDLPDNEPADWPKADLHGTQHSFSFSVKKLQ